MELLIALAFFALVAMVFGGILGIVAFARQDRIKRQLRVLTEEVRQLRRSGPAAADAEPSVPETPAETAVEPTTPAAAPPPIPSEQRRAELLEAVHASQRPAEAADDVEAAESPIAELESATQTSAAPVGLGNWESRIGRQWIALVGAVVVFFSATFFLKHAFDSGWIGPAGQVATCAVAGVLLLIGGSWVILRKGWRALGQSLIGLGLAVLYATFFGAFSLYDQPVLGQTAAFLFMIGVTAAGVGLAIWHDAQPIAFLAVLGGVLTPVLVSTGQDSRDALFGYLLLLDLGVLALSFFRRWALLDTLAMVGTFVLYVGWYVSFYTPAVLGPAIAWLGAFYGVFLVLPFAHHLVRRRAYTIDRYAMAVANVAFCVVFAWAMLHDDHLAAVGWLCVGLAAVYLIAGMVNRLRLPDDDRALAGCVAISETLLTLSVTALLRADLIFVGWVIEAPVLALLGYRFAHRPARVYAAIVLVLGIARMFLWGGWPMHHGQYALFATGEFWTAMTVAASAAAIAGISWAFRSGATPFDRVLQVGAALLGGLLTLVILDAEVGGWVEDRWSHYAARHATSLVWLFGSVAGLAATRRWRASRGWSLAGGLVALAVAMVHAGGLFLEPLGASHVLVLNSRFAVMLAPLAMLAVYAQSLFRSAGPGEDDARTVGRICAGAAVLGVLILLSFEVRMYCGDTIADPVLAERAGQMGVTLVWGLCAAALLFMGFWRRWRPVRLAALGLFGASAAKLVIVDLTGLRDVHRIVSFLVVGLLMLAASYLYHKLEKRLAAPSPSGPATREQRSTDQVGGEDQAD